MFEPRRSWPQAHGPSPLPHFPPCCQNTVVQRSSEDRGGTGEREYSWLKNRKLTTLTPTPQKRGEMFQNMSFLKIHFRDRNTYWHPSFSPHNAAPGTWLLLLLCFSVWFTAHCQRCCMSHSSTSKMLKCQPSGRSNRLLNVNQISIPMLQLRPCLTQSIKVTLQNVWKSFHPKGILQNHLYTEQFWPLTIL